MCNYCFITLQLDRCFQPLGELTGRLGAVKATYLDPGDVNRLAQLLTLTLVLTLLYNNLKNL